MKACTSFDCICHRQLLLLPSREDANIVVEIFSTRGGRGAGDRGWAATILLAGSGLLWIMKYMNANLRIHIYAMTRSIR